MSEQQAQGADAVVDLNNELKTRREKLAALREQGVPFPNDFRRDHTSDQLHADFDGKENEELEALNVEVSVAGRMMTRRIMGKASFVTLQDVGGRIQLYVSRDDLPEGIYNEQFKKWDLGDILGAKGKLFKTKTGELSIHCTELRLLTKACAHCRTNSTVCRIRKRAIVSVTWISSLTMNPARPSKSAPRSWPVSVSSWLTATLWKWKPQ
jgi:lysyl-tRNA synthetase class 2